jgi:hypothetical protein
MQARFVSWRLELGARSVATRCSAIEPFSGKPELVTPGSGHRPLWRESGQAVDDPPIKMHFGKSLIHKFFLKPIFGFRVLLAAISYVDYIEESTREFSRFRPNLARFAGKNSLSERSICHDQAGGKAAVASNHSDASQAVLSGLFSDLRLQSFSFWWRQHFFAAAVTSVDSDSAQHRVVWIN